MAPTAKPEALANVCLGIWHLQACGHLASSTQEQRAVLASSEPKCCCKRLKNPNQAHGGGSRPRKQIKPECKVTSNFLNFTMESNFMAFWI